MATTFSRILVMFLLAASVALFAGCQVQLYGDLAEDDANVVLAALLDAGLSAEKRPGRENVFAIYVEEQEFAAAVNILDARGLPGKRYDDLGNVFGKVAMFSTPLEEKARYLYAMQEELANTVAQIDGVLVARVHLVLPEQDQLGRSVQTPSAAVFVKHVDDERHDPVAHRLEIRRIVSASIPGLDEERIAVSFFPAGTETVLPAPQPWKRMLGLKVAQESAPRLKALLAVGVVVLLLEAAVFLLLQRRRK